MNIGTLYVTLGLDVTQLDASVKHLNTTAQRFRTFGYLATAALTAPMVAFGKASFTAAKDYEYAMQKIVGLTGVAQSTVNEWSKEVLKMGPALARNPKELAEALYFISSSGIKGAEAMTVLEISAKAATAGLGETQKVADLLTSALNAYAGTGLTAAYAADVLVAAVREGKAEASGFASAMGQVIPIASQLGVEFNEVAGGMAAITLTGSSAASAAVYLKGVFNSLLTASTQGEKALNSVGTSYLELRKILAQDGLIALMQKLRDIQLKYGDEILSDVLPNIRALTGFLSIAGKNFKYNTQIMNEITNSTGSLGKAFAAVADTIKVRYDSAISGAQVSLISLGKSIVEAFLPILENLVRKLSKLTEWFNNLTEEQKRSKLQWVAYIAAAGPVSLAIALIGYTLSGIISILQAATSAVIAFTAALVTNPILAVVAALLAAGVALMAFKLKAEKAAEAQKGLNSALEEGSKVGKDNQSIIDRMSMLGVMDVHQLEDLKSDIDKQIQAYKDFRLNKMIEAKQSIKDDNYILDLKKQIWDKEQDVYNWMHNAEAKSYRGPIIAQLQDEIALANKAIRDYKTNIKSLQQFDIEAADANIRLFEGYGTKVADALKKATPAVSDNVNTLVNDYKRLQQEMKNAHRLVLEQYEAELRLQNEQIDTINTIKELQSKEPIDYRKFFMKIGFNRPYEVADPLTRLESQMSKGLVSYREYLDERLKIDLANAAYNADARLAIETKYYEDLRDLRRNNLSSYLQSTAEALNTVASLIEASKQRELSAVGDNAREREKIEKKYLARQKALAIAQAIINGALAVTNLIANVPLSVLNPATWVGIGIAAAGTAAQIAIIASQKMKDGGVVPPGYPNDTYPALLSSGEKVIPKSPIKLESQTPFNGKVVFRISARELVGILEEESKYKKSF